MSRRWQRDPEEEKAARAAAVPSPPSPELPPPSPRTFALALKDPRWFEVCVRIEQLGVVGNSGVFDPAVRSDQTVGQTPDMRPPIADQKVEIMCAVVLHERRGRRDVRCHAVWSSVGEAARQNTGRERVGTGAVDPFARHDFPPPNFNPSCRHGSERPRCPTDFKH